MGKELDVFGGYKPRQFHRMTLEEFYSKLGIKLNEPFSRGHEAKLDRYNLKWLQHAAIVAHSTLNAAINFYPEAYQKTLESILEELRLVLCDIRECLINPKHFKCGQALKLQIEAARCAVAHAGNIFNNTVLNAPKEIRKAILEARDTCDESIRQPHIN